MAVTFFPTDPNVGAAIGRYNQGLSAETLARIQADAQVQEAQMRAKAQQQAQAQQAQQNNYANMLRQQELQQQGAYQQGTLANQRATNEAQMAWQKAIAQTQATESAADRASREKIAGLNVSRYAPDPSAIAAENNIASSHAGRLNFALKNLVDSQAAEEKKVNDTYTSDMAGFSPFTTDKSWAEKRDKALEEVRNRYRQQVGQLVTGVTKDVPVDFDQQRMQFVPRLISTPNAAGSPAANGAPGAGGYFGGGRPAVTNPDGSVSTVRSIGVGDERGQWVIPTVVNGKVVSNDEAIKEWRAGRNNAIGGPFQTIDEATAFGQKFHNQEAQRLGLGGSAPAPREDSPITVRRSNGAIETIRAGSFAAAKQLDPGVEIVSPGTRMGPVASARMPAPPPAETPAANTPGYFGGAAPVAGGNTPGATGISAVGAVMPRLRKILDGVDIGKSPLMNMFGWTESDIPAITKVVLAAEQGQPVYDMFHSPVRLTPQQIDEAKQILYSIAQ
jgi:hypothetical protein